MKSQSKTQNKRPNGQTRKESLQMKDVFGFTNSIFTTTTSKPIIAVFNNGDQVEYTIDVFNLLVTDSFTSAILDGETGEIIWER
jgi:hypothetical protein